MADLAYSRVALAGTVLTYAPASVGGDKVAPNSRGFLAVKNGGASAVDVVVVTPGKTRFGVDEPDVTVSVAAGAEALIGPLSHDLVSDTITGQIAVTYSDATSVSVAAVYV